MSLQDASRTCDTARVAIDGLKVGRQCQRQRTCSDRMQVEHSGTSSYLDALKGVQESMHTGEAGGSKQTHQNYAHAGQIGVDPLVVKFLLTFVRVSAGLRKSRQKVAVLGFVWLNIFIII